MIIFAKKNMEASTLSHLRTRKLAKGQLSEGRLEKTQYLSLSSDFMKLLELFWGLELGYFFFNSQFDKNKSLYFDKFRFTFDFLSTFDYMPRQVWIL